MRKLLTSTRVRIGWYQWTAMRYITVATYGKSHVRFLFDEPLKDSTSSMIMLEHGSFDLGLSKTSETYAD